jgi:hypothetical protein
VSYQVETCSLEDLLYRVHADRVALLKMDIEGSEYEVIAQADSAILRRFERVAVEYHDNLRPGTLDLLEDRLDRTHLLDVRPSTVAGCGVIRAVLR